GRANGLPEVSYRKIFEVLDSGLHALELADRAGVQIAFGTDLLGDMHSLQSGEFTIRSEVQQAADIVRAATVTAARLVRMEGQIAAIRHGAFADLLVVDANPLEDMGVLADPRNHLQLIMKGGRIYADKLDADR